jgi:hypothetical protein
VIIVKGLLAESLITEGPGGCISFQFTAILCEADLENAPRIRCQCPLTVTDVLVPAAQEGFSGEKSQDDVP